VIPEQPGNPHPGLASFRGREAELQQIGQVIGSLLAGHGNTLVVEGPAGIGKSRLLDELAQSATTAGVLVARGQAEELDGLAPLTPLLGALRSGPSPVLAREELRTLERPGDQRFWLLEELTDLLERRCQGAPLAVIIDDVRHGRGNRLWPLVLAALLVVLAAALARRRSQR